MFAVIMILMIRQSRRFASVTAFVVMLRKIMILLYH